VYHVELRQFPHNFCRFNLTERELHETILDAWAKGEWIEFGERKWNPHQAQLTVVEGPQLPLEQLSMGRGWRTAKRQGQDVTEQLLAYTRAAASAFVDTHARGVGSLGTANIERQGLSAQARRGPEAVASAGSELRLVADSLGLELLTKLGTESAPVAMTWWLAHERYPEHSASDCLKLAELAVQSLAEAGLVVVLVVDDSGEYEPCSSNMEVEQALRAMGSWSSTGGSGPVHIRRA
jgi:hypothetical protein